MTKKTHATPQLTRGSVGAGAGSSTPLPSVASSSTFLQLPVDLNIPIPLDWDCVALEGPGGQVSTSTAVFSGLTAPQGSTALQVQIAQSLLMSFATQQVSVVP